jgi:hypothetical protein
MNVEKLKNILIENKIYKSENSKNFICLCCFCGDHLNPSKQGHLYVSKDDNVPVCHCWLCGEAVPIPKLIKDLTGDKNLYKEVISDEVLNSNYKKPTTYQTKQRTVTYKIPDLTNDRFSEKKIYIKKRSGNKCDAEDVPHLIVNLTEFLNLNHLNIVGKNQILSDWEIDILQRNYVCFLSENHTLLYCRNIDDNAQFKFKKIPLQSDNLQLLDYWKIPGYQTSNLIVLAEGNFDILCEHSFDSLGLKSKARLYAAGNSFSYSSLLKSVCFNESLYNVDLVILSDTDKPAHWYNKMRKENSHLIKSCKIYMNKRGKDFGTYPPMPSQIV